MRLMSLLTLTLLFVAVIIGPADLLAKKKVPYNDAYSMEVQALKGPEMTDVYARFSTTNAEAFPIPDQLKKMQVKIKDEDDEVVFILNDDIVDVVDGVATMPVGDPGPHQMLYVQSHIKTATRDVILRDAAPVLFRPDLVVQALSAPDTVKVDELFDIEMIIEELNNDIGATATVSLFDGAELLVSMPDVYVPAGEQVTVVITSLGLANVGTHSFTVVISDADPAEYDDTNNTYSFSLEVIPDVVNQQSSFSMAYENYHDYYYAYNNYNSCSSFSTRNGKSGDWDLLTLSAYSYGAVPEGIIDEVWWQVETEAGIQLEKSETAVAPVNISERLVSYHIYDPDKSVIIDINVFPLDGNVQYTYRQQTGRYYSYNWIWGSWYYYTNSSNEVDAQEFITLRLLIQDENLRIGGEATVLLSSTYVNEYESDSGSSGGGWGIPYCTWSWSETTRYTLIEGDATGTLDPVILGKSIGRTKSADAVLPATISLEGNYPNPFNPSTTLQFNLPEDQLVSLVVYDLLGREMTTLVNGYVAAGTHQVRWNGKTATGADIPTGIYIARMTAGGYSHSIKLVYMK